MSTKRANKLVIEYSLLQRFFLDSSNKVEFMLLHIFAITEELLKDSS